MLEGFQLELSLIHISEPTRLGMSAYANLLIREVPQVCVAAASGGNHGVAVAFAAMRLGIKASIFVSKITSPAKMRLIRGYSTE